MKAGSQSRSVRQPGGLANGALSGVPAPARARLAPAPATSVLLPSASPSAAAIHIDAASLERMVHLTQPLSEEGAAKKARQQPLLVARWRSARMRRVAQQMAEDEAKGAAQAKLTKIAISTSGNNGVVAEAAANLATSISIPAILEEPGQHSTSDQAELRGGWPSQSQGAARTAAEAARAAAEEAIAAAGSAGRLRGVRLYRPVPVGDVELPGGPQYRGLRSHLKLAEGDPSLPLVDGIILVEGPADFRAVQRAVRGLVYLCKGHRVQARQSLLELQALALLGRPLTVLTDPDASGLQLRAYLDDLLAPCSHAFLAEADATAGAATFHHEAGNRGVEHAVPTAVATALRAAAPGFGPARREFDLARLRELGLAGGGQPGGPQQGAGAGGAVDGYLSGQDQGAGSAPGEASQEGAGEQPQDGVEAGRAAAARRRRVCAQLGLGGCTPTQLLAALNRYFTREQLDRALRAAAL